MGFFSFFRKKKKDESEFHQMTIEEALKKYGGEEENLNATEVIKKAEDACIQVHDVEAQYEEVKKEYEAVTGYLADIQRIDLIPLEERETMDDAARKIINLSKERMKFKNNNHSINDKQYHYMEQFEEEIPKELERMKSQEEYQMLVKNDLRQLEGEKGVLSYEKESALEKMRFLKQLSIVVSILAFSVFILLFILSDSTGKDFTVPFFITGLMALGLVLYVILESRNSVYRLRIAEKKLNKVVSLTNKVKIKFVNTTSTLEYSYEKYGVNSYNELKYLWKEYVKLKDESEMYKKNTELLESYNETLIEELKNRGIKDAEVWIFQPEALLDKKEMVEVRHRLNNRRQKLREQIEHVASSRDVIKNSLLSIRKNYPQYRDAVEEIIRYHNIPF